jgi:hypothetical protein
MKMYGGVDVQMYVFLTSALIGGEWLASRPGQRTPVPHWKVGSVDPRADLDDVEKRQFFTLPGLKFRVLSGPARSQSLYRLRYPGSFITQ